MAALLVHGSTAGSIPLCQRRRGSTHACVLRDATGALATRGGAGRLRLFFLSESAERPTRRPLPGFGAPGDPKRERGTPSPVRPHLRRSFVGVGGSGAGAMEAEEPREPGEEGEEELSSDEEEAAAEET